ncbi:MAG: Hpt domain-containing protein [Phycisphaerae bacterium]
MPNSRPTTSADKLTSCILAEDPDFLDIVQDFVRGLDVRFQELQSAYERLDWAELRMLAHRLKGAGASYGYPDLTRLAAHLESSFKAERADDFADRLRELRTLADAARRGLPGAVTQE